MSDWIYPEVINHLKKSCKDFLDEKNNDPGYSRRDFQC
jgi:hypothetical protein